MLYNIFVEINRYYSVIQTIEESKTSVLQTDPSTRGNLQILL